MTEKQAATAPKQRRLASEVAQIAAGFANSGMSREEFCRSRGLAHSTLWRYLKKHAKQHRTKTAKSRLVPVEVMSNPQKVGNDSSRLTLVVTSGRKIEVPPGFDEATLQRLLHLLERR